MHALCHIGYAMLIGHVEGADAASVGECQSRGVQAVWREAVSAGVEHDDVGGGQRAFDKGGECVADLNVVPVPRLRTARALGGILLIEGIDVGLGVVGRFEGGSLGLV